MPVTEAYAEELASLRGLLGEPAPGIHLLEFATIPQLESILSDSSALSAPNANASRFHMTLPSISPPL